jgi:hypothetical protein
MRVITLDINNKISGVKNVGDNYIFEINDIQSDIGEVGQIMQPDGTFIDDPTPIPPPGPTTEERQDQDISQLSADFQGFMDFYFSMNS